MQGQDNNTSSTLIRHIDSGVEALGRGNAVAALGHFQDALSLAPNDAEILSLLGLSLVQLEKFAEARSRLEQAIRLEPQQAGFRMNLVECLLRQEAFDEAKPQLHKVISIQPGLDAAWEKLGQLGLLQGGWQAMQATALDWTRTCPNRPRAWRLLATCQMELGFPREAEQSFSRVLGLLQENALDLSIYGQICLQCFEYEKAARALHRAEMLDPDHPPTLVALALYHTYQGNLAGAETYCRRALDIAPEYTAAWSQLGHLLDGEFSAAEFDSLQSLINKPQLQPAEKVELGFTLGQAQHKRGEFKSAFATWLAANTLHQQLCAASVPGYDPGLTEARTRQTIEVYGPGLHALDRGQALPTPIFIIGMPRSGTTLLEALLGAHSEVSAGGERPLLPQIGEQILGYATEHGMQLPPGTMLEDLAGSYLDDLPGLRHAKFFTDKNPLNFTCAGLIPILFPNAPIIHIRRNPVETCFSIFRHKFSRFWNFAHELAQIAHFYGQYARLMQHWSLTPGERILEIEYETLSSDFTAQAPLVLAHCGLTPEKQCLDFQTTRHPVATLSSVQIRNRVKTARALAEDYGELLRPLQEALLRAGVDPESGDLLQESGPR